MDQLTITAAGFGKWGSVKSLPESRFLEEAGLVGPWDADTPDDQIGDE